MPISWNEIRDRATAFARVAFLFALYQQYTAAISANPPLRRSINQRQY